MLEVSVAAVLKRRYRWAKKELCLVVDRDIDTQAIAVYIVDKGAVPGHSVFWLQRRANKTSCGVTCGQMRSCCQNVG